MNPYLRAPQWSRPASVEISEVPLEGVPFESWLPSFPDFAGRAALRVPAFPASVMPELPQAPPLAWQPHFEDFARARPRVTWFQFVAHTIALSSYAPPDLAWKPVFDDFARAKARVVQFPFGGYTNALPNYEIPNLAWDPRFPDFPGRKALRVADFQALAYTDATPDIPSNNLAWHPVFDDFARARQANNAPYFPAAFFPIPIVFGPNRTLVIHTPDEIPIGAERNFSVEYNIGGMPVALDAPPDMRIYHLDANGFQITDLAPGPCTAYPSGTAYFRAWTPADRGVYIIEIIGTFQGTLLIYVLPVTVRAKFDPFALANDDILVARNGDIGD